MLPEAEIEKIKFLVSARAEITYAILFGSALKRLLAHSDIDLLVGGKLNAAQKADLSMELTLELRRQIDIVSPEEAPCDVVLHAFSSGLPIFVRDTEQLRKDYFKNYHLCDQRTPLKRIRLERLKRVYANG